MPAKRASLRIASQEISRAQKNAMKALLDFWNITLQSVEPPDIAYLFKLARAFISTKELDKAHQVLDYIVKHFLTSDGDFSRPLPSPNPKKRKHSTDTPDAVKSLNGVYNDYWVYTNGWILLAMIESGWHEKYPVDFQKAYGFMMNYLSEDSKKAFTNRLRTQTDILSIAHMGCLLLAVNTPESQQKAYQLANTLCELFIKHQHPSTFPLRFNAQTLEPINNDNSQLFYQYHARENGQLHFMIAYPAAFLALLSKSLENEGNIEDAKKMLDAAKNYFNLALKAPDVYQSLFSHKLAWAASIHYSITHKQPDANHAIEIMKHFTAEQAKDGTWHKGDPLNQCDQTAEICCWLAKIIEHLRPEPALTADNYASTP